MKYYSVRIGKNPGIYNTWDDCKLQIHKYPGAIYKSFSDLNSAYLFLNFAINPELVTPIVTPEISTLIIPELVTQITPELATVIKQEYKLEIYTDGSHFKHDEVGHIGLGAFITYNNKEYSWSCPVTTDILKKYNISEKISNCTAEFLAVTEVLRLMTEIKTEIKTDKTIIFCLDYIGVEKWVNNKWKCNKIYIQNIKREFLNFSKILNVEIRFKHISAHTGVYENEKADKLAKSTDFKDEFTVLFNMFFT